MLSVAVLNPLVGILGYISIWFASFLFSGFFLPEDDVPWPLKVCTGIRLRGGGKGRCKKVSKCSYNPYEYSSLSSLMEFAGHPVSCYVRYRI